MSEWKLLLDDMAKLMASAVGMADGLRQDGRQKIGLKMEKMLKKMDFIRHQEFKVAQAMIQRARSEQEKLAKRVAALEGGKKTPVKKSKRPAKKR